MGSSLEVKEGGLHRQGTDEEAIYTVTTTKWGSSPSSPTVVVYDESDWSDVTSSVGAPTASASGDIITLTALTSLTKGHTYRIEVKFTTGSNIFETHFRVEAVK